jgi:hypothetical protein
MRSVPQAMLLVEKIIGVKSSNVSGHLLEQLQGRSVNCSTVNERFACSG